MEWYPRYADAALCGMRCLTDEQYRAYNVIIDLLYSRDGDLPDDPHLLCRELNWNRQRWLRVRSELFALEKIRMKSPGKLTANRVDFEIEVTKKVSKKSGSFHKVFKGKSFEINGDPPKNASKKTDLRSDTKPNPLSGGEEDRASPLSSSPPPRENEAQAPPSSSARSLTLVARAHSPPPPNGSCTQTPSSEIGMKKYELDPTKFEMVLKPDGSRIIRNIGAVPTIVKVNGKELAIAIDPITGIPTKPGSDQLAWQPFFDASENLLDCRPPWERHTDLHHRARERVHSAEIIEPNQITWSEVPNSAKVISQWDKDK